MARCIARLRFALAVLALVAFAGSAVADDRVPADLPALHRAAAEGKLDALRVLIADGSAVDRPHRWEWTALHWAAIAGQKEAAALLLDRGADPNARGYLDMTPLHWAALKGHPEVVGVLVRRGARADARNLYGMMPLHGAADEATTKALIAGGASIEAVDDRGMTPLETARQGLVARALLKAGANAQHRSHDGLTALDLAVVEALDGQGLSIMARRAAMRLRGETARAVITLRSVTERPLSDLRVAAESRACSIAIAPNPIRELAPAQKTDLVLSLTRKDGVNPGEYAVVFTVTSQGRSLGKFDLKVSTRLDVTPEDRGMIRLGKGLVRPAPSRLYYLIFAVVPITVAVIWWIVRRKAKSRATRGHD